MSIMISGCGNAAQGGKGQVSDIQSNENEPIEIIWWAYTPDGTAPDDAEEVLERANEISAEKIGVTAKMIYKTEEQFDLDLQTGDYYDMTFSCDWCNDFDGNAGKGYYADITEKVQSVTPELYKAVVPWWEVGTLHGKIYGVPMLKDLGAEVFFRMNSDYFEGEKGMTLPKEMSFADASKTNSVSFLLPKALIHRLHLRRYLQKTILKTQKNRLRLLLQYILQLSCAASYLLLQIPCRSLLCAE